MTVAEFQTAFPAFANVAGADIQRHLTAAEPFVDVDTWGDFYDEGLGNLVAHRIVTEEMDRRAMASLLGGGAGGGGPGEREITSKSVDGVSISYATALTTNMALNPYLRTTFGQRYYFLAQRFGGAGAGGGLGGETLGALAV